MHCPALGAGSTAPPAVCLAEEGEVKAEVRAEVKELVVAPVPVM